MIELMMIVHVQGEGQEKQKKSNIIKLCKGFQNDELIPCNTYLDLQEAI